MGTLFAPVEVFYSSAEVDVPLLEQLEHHLSVLRHEGLITTWHQRQIAAGSDWQVELDQHLNTASLILLLISPDFLASNYQYGVELQRAMQRHDANEVRVIPIVVRDCDWKGAPFGRLQVVPRDGKPVTSWHNRDEAFAEIAKEIRATLETIQRLTLSTPPTALPKIWQIPYQRNPVFTGRDDLLQMLTEILQADHSATLSQPKAVSGLGGIGKTQLAVEYAYRTAPKYQAVFWVAAETREALISGYATIAEALHLPEKEEPDQNLMLQAVQRWLRMHTDWLLILDNADDLGLVQSFMPPVFGGQVLLTTREHATGRFAHRVEIDTLTTENGALLLLRRAGVLSAQGALEEAAEQEIALTRQISEALGNLPLALDQAGAYIEETECGLLSYQRQYQQHQASLLQWRSKLASDHPEPVATTWSLAFEKVEQANPLAADLLRFCAFLAPEAIPEEMLIAGALELGPVLAPVASDAFLLDQAIATLRAYSLLARDPYTRTLTVHRLVQVVLRDSLPTETQRQWMQRVVLAVNAAFHHAAFESWPTRERLLPHALVCATWIEQAQITTDAAARLLFQTGSYLYGRVRYVEAEPLYQQALRILEQSLGPEHRDVAYTLNGLANLYAGQGKYAEAEPLYQRASRILEQSLGPEHPDVTYPLNGLATLYQGQGKYAEAEPLYQRALRILEQSLGPEHSRMAYPLSGLASLYREQGKYTEAYPLSQRALHILEQSLGPGHRDVAQTLTFLAHIFHQEGKYAEAEPLYQRALHILEQSLGLEHPDVAHPLNGLAILYKKQGKYAEAEPLYQRALCIREQSLGPEHPRVAYPLSNLANLYQEQGKYREAESLYQRALRIWEQSLGPEHPSTQAVREHYATLLQTMGHDAEANQLEERH
jgi:tetratricopeptide (TPR) repeat protein